MNLECGLRNEKSLVESQESGGILECGWFLVFGMMVFLVSRHESIQSWECGMGTDEPLVYSHASIIDLKKRGKKLQVHGHLENLGFAQKIS